VTERPRGGVFAGILLLGLGLVLLVMQFVPQVRAMDLWSLFPLVVGVAFLAGFGYARQYGFLIPGCILTGLGLGALIDKFVQGGLFGVEGTVVGLGIGFLAIYPIDLAVRGRQPGQWWPLIPGGIILATGVAPALWKDFWQVAPAVALVVIGSVILIRAFAPGGDERSAERSARRAERRARRHGGAVPPGSPAVKDTSERSVPTAADKVEPSGGVTPAAKPPV
jgi:hypothetical protein